MRRRLVVFKLLVFFFLSLSYEYDINLIKKGLEMNKESDFG